MLKYASVALCALALFSCRQAESPATTSRAPGAVQPSDVRNAKLNEVIHPAPQFIDHALLGSELGPDGMVSKESDRIPAGQPVYLTMIFRESPPGLQARAVWTTIDKQPVTTERRPMNGAKVATFTLKSKVKPGRYKVVGYWGGNIATEREFEVTGAAQKAKRKKGSPIFPTASFCCRCSRFRTSYSFPARVCRCTSSSRGTGR